MKLGLNVLLFFVGHAGSNRFGEGTFFSTFFSGLQLFGTKSMCG